MNYAHLFGLPNNPHVTLSDVNDVYDIVKTVRCPKHREEIYVSYGLNQKMVERWYTEIVGLEKSWEISNPDNKKTLVCFGQWKLVLEKTTTPDI